MSVHTRYVPVVILLVDWYLDQSGVFARLSEIPVDQRVVVANVGSNVVLPCKATPIEPVDWEFESVLFIGSRRLCSSGKLVNGYAKRYRLADPSIGDYSISIPSVTKADTGVYICIEASGIGPGKISFHVTVLEQPNVSVTVTYPSDPHVTYVTSGVDSSSTTLGTTILYVYVAISLIVIIAFIVIAFIVICARQQIRSSRQKLPQNENNTGNNSDASDDPKKAPLLEGVVHQDRVTNQPKQSQQSVVVDAISSSIAELSEQHVLTNSFTNDVPPNERSNWGGTGSRVHVALPASSAPVHSVPVRETKCYQKEKLSVQTDFCEEMKRLGHCALV